MFCSVCGSWVEENAAFCPNCGAAINGNVQKKDNSTMQEHGNAAADVQDGYVQIDGTMELTYHPYWGISKGCVYVDNYYVTHSKGNSIARAHISGTKQGSRTHLGFTIFALLLGVLAFSSWSLSGKGIEYVIMAAALTLSAVDLVVCGTEYVLIIKGSGSADAITISTDFFHRRELDPIENAVKALAASHDRDTNVRLQGAMNRAHSEYQTERIIDAFNRK